MFLNQTVERVQLMDFGLALAFELDAKVEELSTHPVKRRDNWAGVDLSRATPQK